MDLMASLTTGERARLTATTDVQGLAALAAHVGAIATIGWLVALRVPGWGALLVVQGVLLVFLFSLLHETTHRTAFRTRWLNRLCARVASLLLVLPADWFRYFHLAHHRHTQDPRRDPELLVHKPQSLREYAAHVSGLPLWAGQIATLWRNALGRCEDAFVPASSRPRVRREARAMVAAYLLAGGLSVAFGSTLLLWVWVVPMMLGQPFLRLFLLAEHAGCPPVSNPLENTRTTLTNPLVRSLAWNMSFHAEHHACPAVPFHRLPALHELARPRLGVTGHGYLRFHVEYLAALLRSGASRVQVRPGP